MQKKTGHQLGWETNMIKLIVIFLIVFISVSSSYAEIKNPFKEGVEKIVLTDEEYEKIKSYVVNSKFLLEDALEKAKAKGLQRKKQIYYDVIKGVVLNSYENRNFNELLMRVMLNQALELTFGTPSADGMMSDSKGVLNNKVADDLLVHILEEHISLAIYYIKSDLDYLESGDLLDLPFNEMALIRLNISKYWIQGIFSVELQNKAYKSIINNFIATVKRDENLYQSKLNEIVFKMYDMLQSDDSSIYNKNRLYKSIFVFSKEQIENAKIERAIGNNFIEYSDTYSERGSYYKLNRNSYYPVDCKKGYVPGLRKMKWVSKRVDEYVDIYHSKICLSYRYLVNDVKSYPTYFKNKCFYGFYPKEIVMKQKIRHKICVRDESFERGKVMR